MKRKSELLKFDINPETIVFWCGGMDDHSPGAVLCNELLLALSSQRKVFLHAYRLPNELDIIDPAVIIEKAEVLLDPFNTYFYLSEAKIKSDCFDCACETTLFYFDEKVKWKDFLATSNIRKPRKLLREGLLFAYFSSADQGADLWFECDRSYETRVFHFFDSMSNEGYIVERTARLSVP